MSKIGKKPITIPEGTDVKINEDNLSVSGKKEVTAGDIQATSDVEIANPDLHLFTTTADSAKIEAEIIVQRGRGYVPTESRQDEKKEIGMIAVDSVYTPITNVSMHVENVRVGQVTNFEQVRLEIETDGTITPKGAVSLASQILVDHFGLLLETDLEPQTVRTDVVKEGGESEESFTGESEVEAPAPKKRGRPKKEEESE